MQKMTRVIKPPFDPEQNFVVNRPFPLKGKEQAPGTPFDASGVPIRRLRQMYETNWIRMVPRAEPFFTPVSDHDLGDAECKVPPTEEAEFYAEPAPEMAPDESRGHARPERVRMRKR